VRPLVLIAVSFAAAWIIVGLVGAIDWAQVGDALGRLSVPALAVLAVAFLGRQILNAVPLTRFVPGLGLKRSMQNDVTANLMGTVAPPPADVVIRVSMFKSWQINPVDGMAGVTLNMLTFYSVRFLAPAVGLLVLSFQGVERGQAVAALSSALIAAAVLVSLALIIRGDAFAAWLGRSAGRVVARVRSSVDPQVWEMATVDFRGRMAETLRQGLFPSMVALLGMVLCDALVLTLSLRFVGVGATVLSVPDIVGAFLISYPLTLMPLVGLGVLDAVLLATWTEIAGLEWEPEIVAGLIVWRAFTILGPLLLGTGSLLLWRRQSARSANASQAGR
jgi:putative heme transporter